MGWLSAAAIVGAAYVAGGLARRLSAATPLTALLAPAAAVLMVAYFYTYDSYFLPSLVRQSENSLRKSPGYPPEWPESPMLSADRWRGSAR